MTGAAEARVPLSPLFAQLVDGGHSRKTEQDAQVLQVGFPRCSLGTWGWARLGGGIFVPSTPPGTPELFWGEGEHPTESTTQGLGRGRGLQPLPNALVWKRHPVLQVPLLSAVTSQTPTL